MKVQDVMTRSPATCLLQDSLHTAAQKLWERDCGCLPVVDPDGRPIAMLTDRDVCMAAWSQGLPLHEMQVATAMSRQLVSCRLQEETSAVASRMAKHGVRRLPVLDADGMLVGIVSLNDLAALARRQPALGSVATVDALVVLLAVSQPRPCDSATAAAATTNATATTNHADPVIPRPEVAKTAAPAASA